MSEDDNAEYISEEYFHQYEKYSKIYGNKKTLLLIQIGKFYESYCTNKEGPNLSEIEKKINVMKVNTNKKSGNIDENGDIKVTKKHPYRLGFPVNRLFNFIEPLIDDGYNVITIDQIGFKIENNKKIVERKTTGIYSKGTYIENMTSTETKFIAIIYISEEKQKNGSLLLSSGMSAVDLSTAKVYVHEAYSTDIDKMFSLDEITRFITTLQPKELYFYYEKYNKNSKYDIDFISNYLELTDIKITTSIDKNYYNLKYQNEILNKVYKDDKSIIPPIELLDISNNIYVIVSLCILMNYVYQKNENLLKNLSQPIFYMNKKRLILGNNSINQLNVIGNLSNSNTKYKNLFDVVNNTSTPLGERYLKSILSSPYTSISELNKIYNMTDEMIDNNFYKIIENHLNNIYDIERFERRIGLLILKPNEIIGLLKSYKNIISIANEIEKNKKKTLMKLVPEEDELEEINKIIKKLNNTFNFVELTKYVNLEFKSSVFNDGIFDDIDKLNSGVTEGYDLIIKLNKKLIKILDIDNSSEPIKIKNNNKEGYYLLLTNIRSKLLKKKLEKLNIIKIDDIKISVSELIFKEVGKNTKIYFNTEKKLAFTHNNMKNFTDEIEILTKKHYLNFLKSFYEKYSYIFEICNKFITKIDFIKSNAKTSKLYGYCRPELIDKKYGYINVKQMRHPIVERIIDYTYTPHDIEIGDIYTGILIYGLNSSGKSVLMKSVALIVILAQSGLYVPAEKCILSPYESIYARIDANDNLGRSLSSFGVEMTELNAILKRANKKILIVADELCKGTEFLSAISIVSSSVIMFSQINASFILTTHLHEMAELDEIKNLKNINIMHLHAEYDEKKDIIFYDRKLKKGSGIKNYGLLVAKSIINNNEFIDNANKIKNKLLNLNNLLVSGKKSKYNSNLLVNECNICKMVDKTYHISPLETHHINFQKNCDSDDFVKDKKFIKKNQVSNLIILCNKCHDKIHSGEIEIDGWIMTSKGKTIIMKKNESSDSD